MAGQTRGTELAEARPEHVVCTGIGNSKAVAKKHYLQVTEEHFEQAAQLPDATDEVAQNATQQMFAESCTTLHPVSESAKFDAKRDSARVDWAI
ncbi:MAG: hypothetical protein ACYTEK_18640 [Planctomycetota bacterium]|jgi:hypothetical protein